MEKRVKRQQEADEVRFLLVKTRSFSKILCDTVEKTNELARRLEANIEECIAPVQPQNVYQNKAPSSGDRVLHGTTQSFFSPLPLYTQSLQNKNAVITGVVRLILSSYSFVRKDGTPGAVQSVLVVDTLAKRLKSDVYRYKFVVWDEQAKYVPVEKGRTYRFEHFKRQQWSGSLDVLHLTCNIERCNVELD
jgi:hypothetical protein